MSSLGEIEMTHSSNVPWNWIAPRTVSRFGKLIAGKLVLLEMNSPPPTSVNSLISRFERDGQLAMLIVSPIEVR